MNNKFKYDKLKYYFKSEDKIPVSFNRFNRPLVLIRKIRDGSIDLEKFRSYLSETTTEKQEHTTKEEKSTISYLKVFYKAR